MSKKIKPGKFGVDFCDYQTNHAGKCGMYTPDGSGRCQRHKEYDDKKAKKKAKEVQDKSMGSGRR